MTTGGVLSRTLRSGWGGPLAGSQLEVGQGAPPAGLLLDPPGDQVLEHLPAEPLQPWGQGTLNWMPAGIEDGALPEGPRGSESKVAP